MTSRSLHIGLLAYLLAGAIGVAGLANAQGIEGEHVARPVDSGPSTVPFETADNAHLQPQEGSYLETLANEHEASMVGRTSPSMINARRLPSVEGGVLPAGYAEYVGVVPSALPNVVAPKDSATLPKEPSEIPPRESTEALPGDVKVVEPAPRPPPKIWDGSFELGLDGSEGNSQRFNFRCGVQAKRKTDDDVLKLDLDYHKNTSHSEETAHRAFLDWRYEWLFEESPWTWFGHGTVDYDEFQAFDIRVSIDAGLGYQLIDAERTSLLGRLGGGWSREVGGPDDDYVPEATFGSELEHEFSPRQKLTASIDYTPDVSDFRDFRLTTKAGWEVLLDEQMNLSLKLSVLDRYDSTPHGVKPNDVDYSVTLLWKF